MFLLIMEKAAEFLVNGERYITWESFDTPLEKFSGDTIAIGLSDGQSFAGFERIPSALRSFLDEKLESFGPPVNITDCTGQNIEKVMRMSMSATVLEYMPRRDLVFREIQEIVRKHWAGAYSSGQTDLTWSRRSRNRHYISYN